MKCLFRHKYTPIVAQQGDKVLINKGERTDMRTEITMVTLKCQRCGKLKQQTLLGHVTLEDILGGRR